MKTNYPSPPQGIKYSTLSCPPPCSKIKIQPPPNLSLLNGHSLVKVFIIHRLANSSQFADEHSQYFLCHKQILPPILIPFPVQLKYALFYVFESLENRINMLSIKIVKIIWGPRNIFPVVSIYVMRDHQSWLITCLQD